MKLAKGGWLQRFELLYKLNNEKEKPPYHQIHQLKNFM